MRQEQSGPKKLTVSFPPAGTWRKVGLCRLHFFGEVPSKKTPSGQHVRGLNRVARRVPKKAVPPFNPSSSQDGNMWIFLLQSKVDKMTGIQRPVLANFSRNLKRLGGHSSSFVVLKGRGLADLDIPRLVDIHHVCDFFRETPTMRASPQRKHNLLPALEERRSGSPRPEPQLVSAESALQPRPEGQLPLAEGNTPTH